ncbi:DUF7341 domain-containing protein [Pseudarthrobacter sp. YS3]|uniref:DUF7341 domain-containing protein n=1 Tax=Pseudarthrobacter sp. YS3 TaxID=3453718 RepID=UPI003EEB8E4E
MTDAKLNETVHRLTRDHRTTVADPETGTRTYPTELALFTQLEQELSSSSRPSGGASTGPRIPLALAAVMLWSEIRETLNTKHIAITGRDDTLKPPAQKLQEWAAWAGSDEAAKCLRASAAWARAIEQLINPIRRTEITGACPAVDCGATHAWTWEDGEYVRNTAIMATGSEARCGACGTAWVGAELHSLALGLRKDAA